MIRNSVVLILGAGVSHEYGFPLGRPLLMNVSKNLMERTSFHQSLEDCGFLPSQIRHFATNLLESMLPSIDAFLESNSEFREVGKAAIAASLIPFEKIDALKSRNAETLKLYEYLWQHISAPASSMYGGNRLSVITFNYDRSFEQFLRNTLYASHSELRADEARLEDAVSKFDVVHVYGSLGELNSGDPKSNLVYDLSKNGQPLTSDAILAAARRIRLYHESDSASAAANRVTTLLEEAEVVCFLGFAFHPTNVKWLQHYGLGKNTKTQFFGSAFGLLDGQIATARRHLGLTHIALGKGKKSLEFLQDSLDLG